jgi:hypothetical protein
MRTVSRAHAFTRQAQPTFHGLRVEPFEAGPVYLGIAAVATVAIAAIVLNLRAERMTRVPVRALESA